MTSRTSSIAARNFCSSMCVRRANTRKTIFPAQFIWAKASSNVTSGSGFPILTRPWCFIVAADFALRWRPTICRRWVIRMCSQWMEESAAGAKKDTHSHGSRCDPVSLPPPYTSPIRQASDLAGVASKLFMVFRMVEITFSSPMAVLIIM